MGTSGASRTQHLPWGLYERNKAQGILLVAKERGQCVAHGGREVVWLPGCDPWAPGSEAVFSTIEASLLESELWALGVGQSRACLPTQKLPGTLPSGQWLSLTQSPSLWQAGLGKWCGFSFVASQPPSDLLILC